MTDSYQPIYDAVRSKISSCNSSDAISTAASNALEGACHTIQIEASNVAAEMQRPFMLLRPRMTLDGDKWICCYGDNIQDGVVGIGNTPDGAARDFDRVWWGGGGP